MGLKINIWVPREDVWELGVWLKTSWDNTTRKSITFFHDKPAKQMDVIQVSIDLAEYQKTIEPNGGYGYYLERETDNSMIGTAIDGNDGLLLFVIEVHNSND